MSIIALLLAVILLALAIYIVRLIPDATAQRIITVVLVVLFVLWLVDALFGGFGTLRVGHLR
jgi:uncharacterized membrane protein